MYVAMGESAKSSRQPPARASGSSSRRPRVGFVQGLDRVYHVFFRGLIGFGGGFIGLIGFMGFH